MRISAEAFGPVGTELCVALVIIWDGASFHRANHLKVPVNVTLIPLPQYSPELNGIENLWHYLRSHCWSNRSYENYDDLIEVASCSWCQHCLNTDLIKSICAKSHIPTRSKFLRIGSQPTQHGVVNDYR